MYANGVPPHASGGNGRGDHAAVLASSWHKAAVVGLPGGAKPFEVDFRHELVKRVRRKIEAESFQEVGCPASGLCRVVGIAALCQTTFAPLGAPALAGHREEKGGPFIVGGS